MERETEKLLEEVNAGIKMAVDAIQEVLPSVKDETLRAEMIRSLEEHQRLGDETHAELLNYGSEGKKPNPIARGMSWIKTEMKLTMDDSDDNAAGLIAEGCDMGIRSLSKYVNDHPGASDRAVELAGRLTRLEERLCDQMRRFMTRHL